MGFLLRYVAEAAAWLGYCVLLLKRAVQQLEEGVAYDTIYLTVISAAIFSLLLLYEAARPVQP